MSKCKTIFVKSAIDSDFASALYYQLKEDVLWENGIKSKKGYTRKAKAIDEYDIQEVNHVIALALHVIGYSVNCYAIDGIYLNYYVNETMWTPNHTHPGTHQLIISLGETRTLTINKKEYPMSNGVPKSDTPKDGRISIAVFNTIVIIDKIYYEYS